MTEHRQDAWTTALSRRAALSAAVAAGAGLAAPRLAGAQEATPIAPEAVELLFVQSARATTLEPGSGDIHTLTMTDVTAQTLYFSNRPHRIAGAMPTETFVDQFAEGFGDIPPNAALIGIGEVGAHEEEATVIELMNPSYDAATATLAYEVILLSASVIGDRSFEEEPLSELDMAREYSEAHLFIDNTEDDMMQRICAKVGSTFGYGRCGSLGQ